MKTFEELIALAKSRNIPKTLSDLERNTVHGLRGILIQFKEKEMDADQCRMVRREIELAYDHAQTEQMIHRNACRMRVELARVNRDVELHGCELCRKVLKIIDGRLRLENREESFSSSQLNEKETEP